MKTLEEIKDDIAKDITACAIRIQELEAEQTFLFPYRHAIRLAYLKGRLEQSRKIIRQINFIV